MKRAVLSLVLGVMTVAPAPRLQATAYRCILTNNCTPLPCDFMTELKVAKAEAAVYRNAKVSERSYQGLAGTIYDQQTAQPLEQAYAPYSTCISLETRPKFYFTPTCEVGVKKADNRIQAVSRDEALKISQTCSEVVEAAYSQASALRYACERSQSQWSSKVSVDARNQQLLEAAELRIELLQAELRRYLNSCAPDAKLSQDITDLGLDALKSAAQEVRENWQASRASNQTASGR